MKFRLYWLNARKNLFFASLLDFCLYIFLFLNTFQNLIANKSILIFLFLINGFIWIISSYIIGLYSYKKREGIYFFTNLFTQHFQATKRHPVDARQDIPTIYVLFGNAQENCVTLPKPQNPGEMKYCNWL